MSPRPQSQAPAFTPDLFLNMQLVLSRAGAPGAQLLFVPLERDMLERMPGHHSVPHHHPQYRSHSPWSPGVGDG